jgi:hypothetical protein
MRRKLPLPAPPQAARRHGGLRPGARGCARAEGTGAAADLPRQGRGYRGAWKRHFTSYRFRLAGLKLDMSTTMPLPRPTLATVSDFGYGEGR